MLISLLPKDVKVKITIDDKGLKSNSTTNKPKIFTKKQPFLYNFFGFMESDLGLIGDVPGFVQLTPGSYKSDKPVNITGIDEKYLKCDCIFESLVSCTREPILYSFLLSSPPSHEMYKEPRIKLLEKINKTVFSHITLYLEDEIIYQ